MRRDSRPAGLIPVGAVAAALLVTVPAVALPLAAGGILVALPDVAVGAVLAASAVLLLRPGHRRAGIALALASGIWTLVGLAPLFPPGMESALSRCALLPHALVVVALTSIGTGRDQMPPGANRRKAWTRAVGDLGGYLLVALAVAAGLGVLTRPLLLLGVAAAAVGAVRVWSARTRAERFLAAMALALGSCWVVVDVLRLTAALPAATAPGTVDLSLILVALGLTVTDPGGDLWRAVVDPRADGTMLALRLGAALGTAPVEVWFEADGRTIDSDGRPAEPVAAWPFLNESGHVVGLTSEPLPASPVILRELSQILDRAGSIAALRARQRTLSDEIRSSRADLLRAADRERAGLEDRLRRTALARLDAITRRLPAGTEAEVRTRVEAVKAELLNLARGLDPLAGRSPSAAIAELVARTPGARIGSCDLPHDLDRTTARTLWYACAEALSNAVKHCPGAPIRVDAGIDVRDPAWLTLTVRDSGSGGADPSGSGLRGLSDRVAATGGRLTVTSTGAGTEVSAHVPRSGAEHQGSSPAPIGVVPDALPFLRDLASTP